MIFQRELFLSIITLQCRRILRGRNLVHVLFQLVNNIVSAMNNRESKAFDTTDDHILLNKLDHYCIRGHSFNRVSSYLTNRKQLVQFTLACSQPELIVCGIPQGSILGPLLFIYINDLSNASNLLKTFLFADDSSLYYSDKGPNQLIRVMNCELSTISKWLKVNKLSTNVAKTNYILFRPRQKPVTVSDTITLDNIAVQQVEVTKFLGVLLDQHLSWKYHITHVAKKVSKAIGIISKARFFLSSKSLLSLYYTLVYPYLNYCNIAWCSTYPSNLNRILYLQKRIV